MYGTNMLQFFKNIKYRVEMSASGHPDYYGGDQSLARPVPVSFLLALQPSSRFERWTRLEDLLPFPLPICLVGNKSRMMLEITCSNSSAARNLGPSEAPGNSTLLLPHLGLS